MGIVSKTRAASQRLSRQAAKKTGVTLTKETDEFLAKFPVEMRAKLLPKATKAAATIVKKSTQQRLAPYRSKDTGTREGWSENTRQRRESHGIDLHDAMTVKTVNYNNAKGGIVISMVGARWPYGNHHHLLEFGGYQHRLWGGVVDPFPQPPRPTLRPAVESTIPAQQAAMIGIVSREWEKL